MSAQLGIWNFAGGSVAPDRLKRAEGLLRPYGPDLSGSYSAPGIAIRYRAFHTTKESRLEMQPHISQSGSVITWDGRLDNRTELIHQFSDTLACDSPDILIVGAAYRRWGANCLAKLVGDWALSVWNQNDHSLLLAKDFVGTRHLYYSLQENQVAWSTLLDSLVRFADRPFDLNYEYVAGWLSYFPATHLTPYADIHSVPPSSFVLIRHGQATITTYWNFDPIKRIRYRRDADYEEHFRSVFAESVRRRLRSDAPILAELSGGMDSSSIVCMADCLSARGMAEAPRIDTLSYYDNTEPNWNEPPYFARVEEKRGRAGSHIDISSQEITAIDSNYVDESAASPGDSRPLSKAAKQFAASVLSNGNRIVLSGTGGDEVLGGVPTPTLELADLLAGGHLRQFAQQLKLWALNKRAPWVHLFFETIRGFFPSALVGAPLGRRPAEWFHPSFVRSQRVALSGYHSRLTLFDSPPSFQENLLSLEGLRRQLGCTGPNADPLYDKSYPYLDRDLLEFLYAIPREQLVRPGERRSLMRRALAGIVPDEILHRRRKAFIVRAPLAAITTGWGQLEAMCQDMVVSSLGIVDSNRFCKALEMGRRGLEIPIVALARTLALESWLRGAASRKLFDFRARRPAAHMSTGRAPILKNRLGAARM